MNLFIYLFGVLPCFQHCTGHMMMGSFVGRENQYIQLVKVLYCKQSTKGKQLPSLPLEAGLGFKLRSQRWEARVLPLCHCGLILLYERLTLVVTFLQNSVVPFLWKKISFISFEVYLIISWLSEQVNEISLCTQLTDSPVSFCNSSAILKVFIF